MCKIKTSEITLSYHCLDTTKKVKSEGPLKRKADSAKTRQWLHELETWNRPQTSPQTSGDWFLTSHTSLRPVLRTAIRDTWGDGGDLFEEWSMIIQTGGRGGLVQVPQHIFHCIITVIVSIIYSHNIVCYDSITMLHCCGWSLSLKNTHKFDLVWHTGLCCNLHCVWLMSKHMLRRSK